MFEFTQMFKLKLFLLLHQYLQNYFTFDQNFFIDNIAGEVSREIVNLADGKLDIPWRPYSRHGNVELTVGKAGIFQPNTNILESLALRLVYCHGKGHTNWELTPTPIKWKLIVFWSQGYSGN